MKQRSVLRVRLAALLALVPACAGRQSPAGTGRDSVDLASSFADAVQAEQSGGADAATQAYLSLLDRALGNPSAPHATEAWLAALSALTESGIGALDSLDSDQALVFRKAGGPKEMAERLGRAYESAARAGPFARAAIADSALGIAEHEGDAASAKVWRQRTGCARSATVIGPLAWPPITAVAQPTPVENATAPLAPSYPGVGPFAEQVAPMAVAADDCDISLVAGSVMDGLRAVIVDVEVPRPMTIGVMLESSSTAALLVGGQLAARRGYELGARRVEKWATADIDRAGRVRVVARVGMSGEGSRIRLRFLAENGAPLATHAPLSGESATASATRATEVTFATEGASDRERALIAAGWMAQENGRSAEHLLEEGAGPKSSPLTALLYARAIDLAGDLPENRAIERARDAYETVLGAWPTAWEAIVGHAQLTARRRGASEGRLEALREIAKVRTHDPPLDPVVFAFEALLATEGGLLDVREAAFERAKKPLAGTALLAELDQEVHDRVGAEREQYACRTPGLDRGSLACFDAKVARGDRSGAFSEIARLRELRDSPTSFRQIELEQYIALGDDVGMRRVYDSMYPAERTLSALGLLVPRAPSELKERMAKDLFSAADVPGVLAPFATSLLESPAPALEAAGAERIAADRKRRAGSNAATLVLEHTERYAIATGGLLHYTLYDLRRVLGTTDVEEGAQAGSAIIEGRDVRRTLRRRIHKPDGRVLEPDRASYASQGHADLSQLETGDYVEQIVEGWALPGASGQLVVDTPDLLPGRTSVEHATIEVDRPSSLSLAVWAHALWGRPNERSAGGRTVSTFTMRDRPPRRLEGGVPKMDRDVAVSFGSSSWKVIGRSIAEAIAALDDRDPFVSRWAREAAQGESKNPRAVVDRVVTAVGKAVKVASGVDLSDLAASGPSGAQSTTGRTILELGQGSRSWLAHRALRELGIESEIVVAETEPFSADPNYPAHFGRFNEPLVLVHLADGPLWLNLDIQGPPLPAGRISPELRGRVAMNAEGTMVPVGGGLPEDDRDEVDMRLKLDDKGNAAGTFAILVRGRTAQALADALEKVVGTDRADMLRAVVLGWVPWANVDDVALSSSEGSWQVALRASVSIPGYAQAEGTTWVLPGFEPLHAGFPRPFVGSLGATFASQGSRESALSIERAFQYHVHRRLELPPGASLASTPPAVEVKSDSLEAMRRAKLESGALDESFALSIATGTIDPTRYRQFAEDAHRIDDGFQAATRVRAKAVAVPGAKTAPAAPAARSRDGTHQPPSP